MVDDGSSDGTVRATAEFVRRHGFDAVRVLRLPRNRGKGYAGGLLRCGSRRGGAGAGAWLPWLIWLLGGVCCDVMLHAYVY